MGCDQGAEGQSVAVSRPTGECRRYAVEFVQGSVFALGDPLRQSISHAAWRTAFRPAGGGDANIGGMADTTAMASDAIEQSPILCEIGRGCATHSAVEPQGQRHARAA